MEELEDGYIKVSEKELDWQFNAKRALQSVKVGVTVIAVGLILEALVFFLLVGERDWSEVYFKFHALCLIIQTVGVLMTTLALFSIALKEKDVHPTIKAALIIGGIILIVILLTKSVFPWPYTYGW